MPVYVETNPKKSMYIRTTPSWQKYDSLTLQYSYKVFQTKIIKKLLQKKKMMWKNTRPRNFCKGKKMSILMLFLSKT